MPKPTQQIISLGSVWLIDEHEMKYCRLPREEGPRQSPPGEDWGGPSSGVLRDNVWHEFTSWRFDRGTCRLIIKTPSDVVSAPVSRDVVFGGGGGPEGS